MLEIVCAHGLFAIFDRCPPRGRRTIGDGPWPCEASLRWRRRPTLSSEENKFARSALLLCLFCKNREEKIDLEASRCGIYPMLELSSVETRDDLAGRIWWRGWVKKEACHSGRSLLVFGLRPGASLTTY
jgi:hypothetical protein